MSKLYGVGVGPGDPELITIKAARTLEAADVIAAPKMKSGVRTALEIAAEFIKGKPVIECGVPMTKDKEKLRAAYEENADIIEKELKAGKDVAFVTLGDTSVYSSYMQVDRIISARGYETSIVPGITSFSAAAARLGMALCERDEPLVILPSSYDETAAMLDLPGTKVLMKANSKLLDVRDMLEEKGLIEKSVMVEKCGMDGERIYTNLRELNEQSSYFSIIIVKDGEND